MNKLIFKLVCTALILLFFMGAMASFLQKSEAIFYTIGILIVGYALGNWTYKKLS